MNKLLIILLAIALFPFQAHAITAVPWLATSTTAGVITPAKVNGVDQNINILGNLTVSGTTTSGAIVSPIYSSGVCSGLAFQIGSYFNVNCTNGNVGIGTASPSAKLHITPASGNALLIDRVSGSPSIKAGASDGWLIMDSAGKSASINHYVTDNVLLARGGGNVGIGTTSPSAKLSVKGSGTGTGKAFSVADSADAEKFTVLDNGNVGIGTAAPTGNLHIQTGTVGAPNVAADELVIEGGATAGLSILGTTDSNIYFGDAADDNVGLIQYRHNDDFMRFYTNAAERVRIDTSGNVGIGTVSPAAPLNVASGVNSTTEGIRVSETTDSTNRYLSLSSSNITMTRQGGSGVSLDLTTSLSSGAWGTGGGAITFKPRESEAMRIASDGNVGIGTTNPAGNLDITTTGSTVPLVINKGSETSVRERLLTAKVSDDSTSSFFINNGTITNGAFAPVFGGYTESTTAWPIAFSVFVNSTADASDSANYGLIDFSAMRTTSGSDPLNGTLSSIQNRKLFTFRGGPLTSDIKMTVLANGRVGIGTASPGYSLDVAGQMNAESATFPVARYVRTTTATGGAFGTLTGISSGYHLITRTSSDMTDGFGGGLVFSTNDSDISGNNFIARIYARRDGADETGALEFMTGTNGDNTAMILRGDGNVGIGTTNPSTKLEVSGGTNNNFSINPTGSSLVATLGRTGTNRGAAFNLNTNGTLSWTFGTSDSDSAGDGTEFFIGQEGGGLNAGLWMETNGNVGIGTTNPAYKLHVSTSGGSDFITDVSSTAGISYIGTYGDNQINFVTNRSTPSGSTKMVIASSGNVGIGTTSPSAKLSVTGSGTGTGKAFSIANSSNAEKFTVLDNGNVGIGTSVPSYKTHILGGTAGAETTLLTIQSNFTDTDTISTLRFGNSTGATALAGTAEIAAHRTNTGTSGATDLVFRNSIGLSVTEKMRILANGNVGIGTTTPAMKLDVYGQIRATSPTKPTCTASLRGAIQYDESDDHFYGCRTAGWAQLNN